MAKKEKSEEYLKYQRYIKSKEWKELRDKIINERGKCAFCGRKHLEDGVKLSLHHNSYQHLYDEINHLEDVTVICNVCHIALHRIKNNFKRFKIN